MWALLLAWWQKSYSTVLKWAGIVAAALLVWFNIKQSGRKEERAAALEEQNKQAEKANAVENDVRRLGDGAALDELRRDWTRKQ
jgi:hypothetical protein